MACGVAAPHFKLLGWMTWLLNRWMRVARLSKHARRVGVVQGVDFFAEQGYCVDV
jgi:hypothetical protein